MRSLLSTEFFTSLHLSPKIHRQLNSCITVATEFKTLVLWITKVCLHVFIISEFTPNSVFYSRLITPMWFVNSYVLPYNRNQRDVQLVCISGGTSVRFIVMHYRYIIAQILLFRIVLPLFPFLYLVCLSN